MDLAGGAGIQTGSAQFRHRGRYFKEWVMAAFRRYTGNRLEDLAGRLAQCMRPPLSSPLVPDIVVVQSKGMERWLSLELARRHGICANIRFPFPKSFLDGLFSAALPEFHDTPAYDPDVMTWQIMAVLPSCLQRPAFRNLARYLQDDADGLKIYQLSCRLADLFDQYLVFRPDMVMEWEAGRRGYGEEAWQAELWRALRERDGTPHPAILRRTLLERIRDSHPMAFPLPERIGIFGISYLPRFYLELFHALSDRLDVNLFAMNPCREFWTDIRSERETGQAVEKVRASTGIRFLSQADLHLEEGNRLLASMGRQGRNFFSWLMDLPGEEHDLFSDPGEDTLLHAIQSDILHLRQRNQPGEEKTVIDTLDHSIMIHSCHSPMREVEVLHDQILAFFDDDPGLLPQDILIMAPDMDLYAPLIQAVFDSPAVTPPDHPAPPKIPFTIADRNLKKDSSIADAFLSLLDLCGSRFEVSPVLALLDTRPVRNRFGLSDEDMQRIRRWVYDVRIRWGIDAEARLKEGLPGFPENTWKAGMERLLLGYAMPGREERLFSGILPYDAVEGLEAQTLGSLAEYLQGLFDAATALSQARTPGEWESLLVSLLARFFHADEENQEDIQAIRRSFRLLALLGKRAGFGTPVTSRIVKSFLKRQFEQQEFGSGFMSGGVTCCAMLPMRSIPFKVICLLGMNHDDYPRSTPRLGFDLMAADHRPGDRSRRHDDRYLFLESLLSARQILYISYVGQSIVDNSSLPPSVLVSELLDTVEQEFSVREGSVADLLVTHHRLQAFHPAYFSAGSRLFSYSKANLDAAGQLLRQRHGERRFLTGALPDPSEDWGSLDVIDLVHFFRNPCRFLLERRLDTRLDQRLEKTADREAFDIEGLERYGLEQQLLEGALAGRDLNGLFPVFLASGRLPHGNVGVIHYERLTRAVEKFAAAIRPCLADDVRQPVDVRVNVSGFQLHGRIEAPLSGVLYHYRYAALKPQDHLRAWVHHLILNGWVDGHETTRCILIGHRQAWLYPPVSQARTIIEQLLGLYRKGLSVPLKFFPEASWTYAEQKLQKGKTRAEALRMALSVWKASDYRRGESDDPYYRRFFDGQDPLDEEFEQHAELIYEPLMVFRREHEIL